MKTTQPHSSLEQDTLVKRLGIDAIERVFTFENHDRAYQIWREAQVKDQVLLHIDAHHDMWWAKRDNEVTIANFISPAMRDGLVREVIWVVPDGSWSSRSNRQEIVRHLKRIRRQHPGPRHPIESSEQSVSVLLNGRRLTVYPLSLLPEIEEPVLLDIDTDFLVIPKVSHRKVDEHGEVPWCWPDGLLAALRARHLRTSLVTIAYSVEGGYTPLKWKYLGDELRLRLRESQATSQELTFYSAVQRASKLAASRDSSAEQEFRRAVEINPGNAAGHANLALYLFEQGRTETARAEYQEALRLDPSYRSGYAQKGFVEYSEKHYDRAEREFRRMLELNPADAYSYFGLALLAKRKRQWDRVRDMCKSCLTYDGKIIEAQRLMGDALSHLGHYREAATAYEQSLKLALLGVKRFTVLLTPEGTYSLDEGHWITHAKLARAWQKLGWPDKALNGYRMAIASKHAKPGTYLRMALLLANRREFREVASVCTKALVAARDRISLFAIK